MKKEFQVSGGNGIFIGVVKVTKNKSSKKVTSHCPSRHEEIIRIVKVHQVASFINGEEYQSEDATTDTGVEKAVQNIERGLISKLTSLANDKRIKTLEDKLKDNGYS